LVAIAQNQSAFISGIFLATGCKKMCQVAVNRGRHAASAEQQFNAP